MILLIIRALHDAEVTAKRAEGAGFEPVILPLFAISPVTWTLPDPAVYDAILITSANAVRYGGAELSALAPLPVYAVGDATAQAARQAGLTVAAQGTKGGAEILQAAVDAGHRRIIWLAGAHISRIEPPIDVQLDQIVVYQAIALPPPDNFADLLRQEGLVTALHSPRSAAQFIDIYDASGADRANMALAAISPAVANAAGTGWRKVVVADAPNDAALLQAAKSVFTN